jgi:hypothetical protein
MTSLLTDQDLSRARTPAKDRLSQKTVSVKPPHEQGYEPATLSSKSLWGFFAASVVMIFGLQLDAFKHATDPNLETFFTIWHAIMYAGMALCGGTIAWFIRRNTRLGAPNFFAAIPLGFHGAVAGMAILMVSGGIDTAHLVWH